MKTAEEIQLELETAKLSATKDANRRKLMYASAENQMLLEDKKQESIKLFISIVKKYDISGDDIVTLIETVPYI